MKRCFRNAILTYITYYVVRHGVIWLFVTVWTTSGNQRPKRIGPKSDDDDEEDILTTGYWGYQLIRVYLMVLLSIPTLLVSTFALRLVYGLFYKIAPCLPSNGLTASGTPMTPHPLDPDYRGGDDILAQIIIW